MKKILLIALLAIFATLLTSCGWREAPLTEAQQAEKYNMTSSEYKEMKDAAARMNMTIDEHMKMIDTDDIWWMNHWSLDMWDDSLMIEDDFENMNKIDDDAIHMETMHKWENIKKHSKKEH